MIIDSVTLHNFGPFLGRHVVDISPVDKPRNVTLFGGLNGAGKTSILEGLQLALFGRLAQPARRSGSTYDEFMRRAINRNASPGEGAAVGISFRYMFEAKERRYEVLRRWTAGDNSVREYLEVDLNGIPVPALAETWAEHVEAIFPSRISPLFFFDGERIESLADPKESSALLREAIQSLLGLDIVDRLSADLSILERRKRNALAEHVQDNGMADLLADLERLRDLRREQVQRESQLMNVLDRATKSLEEVDVRFRREGGTVYEMRVDLEARRSTLAMQLEQVKLQLRQAAAGPLPFQLLAKEITALGVALDQDVKILQARANATELMRVRDALCDHLQSLDVSQVADPVRTFLDAELSALNELADRTVTNNSPWSTKGMVALLVDETIPQARIHAGALIVEHARIESELRTVEQRISQVPAGDAIATLMDERDLRMRALRDAERDLAALHESVAETDRQIGDREKQQAVALAKGVDRQFEREDANRVMAVSERTRRVLDAFRHRVLEKHVRRLQKFILESYQQLLRKQSLVREIVIDPETLQLRLVDPRGHLVPAERLSAAERQLLAVAILWGLARASGRALPTIIDTPLGRLDSTHRDKLCGRYFPQASHQVLLFSTDEEIVGDLLELMKPSLGRTYLLQHDEPSGTTNVSDGYFAATEVLV